MLWFVNSTIRNTNIQKKITIITEIILKDVERRGAAPHSALVQKLTASFPQRRRLSVAGKQPEGEQPQETPAEATFQRSVCSHRQTSTGLTPHNS